MIYEGKDSSLLGWSRREEVFLFCLILVAVPSIAFAHKGEKHSADSMLVTKQDVSDGVWLERINEDYIKTVKPIFQKSCFDCHGQNSKLPWYYNVPLIHGMMNQDMLDAKEHLDMTKDFPFGGHGKPLEDLKAILESIVERTMPPDSYRMMHWDAGLSESEKQVVLDWIARSEKLITGNQK